MGCSGFTVLSNTGHLLFQAPGSSGVLDGISSTRSAPHIVLELSVTDFQFKAFFLFCHYFKLDPIPATLDTVCFYVQFLSRTLTPASIRNYLSGVKLLHLFTGADYPFTKDFILSLTLRGIARNALHTPRRAPPVTPSILLSISHVLDCEGDPRSSTLFCAFLFTFYLMARLANIVPSCLNHLILAAISPVVMWLLLLMVY